MNVLVNAFRRDAGRHEEYLAWLKQALESAPFGYSELVLSGFMRVVTNPRIYSKPATLGEALGFVDFIRGHEGTIRIFPQSAHWEIFTRLCRAVEAKANAIPDAYLAALAIESGSLWFSADRGFARFPGLKWRHPLD